MISSINNSQSSDHKDLIRKTAGEFGSLFMSMMLKEMRKTTGESEFLPKSFGEKLYTEMLDDKYSSMISDKTLSGFQDMIAKEIERLDNIQNSDISTLRGLNFSDQFAQFRLSNNQQNTQLSNDTMSRVSKWSDLIDEASVTYNVDKNLIKAVIARESAGNPLAISSAGAKGLMQLMDSTATDMKVRNVFSPRDNIMGGVKYLSAMLQRYNGDEVKALASYNAGPSAVDKYGTVPPYEETQSYVKEVLKYRDFISSRQE